MSPMTSETRPIMTANAMRNARKAGGTPWVPFPERLERLEKLELKFPPISAKKATAASLKNVRHRKGRARKSRVRWRAGPMASLALSGLMAGQKESSTESLPPQEYFSVSQASQAAR